jgi:hypothetical protein
MTPKSIDPRLLRSIQPTRATDSFQSRNSGTLLDAERWLISVALGAIVTPETEPAE